MKRRVVAVEAVFRGLDSAERFARTEPEISTWNILSGTEGTSRARRLEPGNSGFAAHDDTRRGCVRHTPHRPPNRRQECSCQNPKTVRCLYSLGCHTRSSCGAW